MWFPAWFTSPNYWAALGAPCGNGNTWLIGDEKMRKQGELPLGILVVYCIPSIFTASFFIFEMTHTTKFYLDDLGLSPSQFGLVTLFVSSLGLFMNLLVSYVVDYLYSRYQSYLTLILVCCPLISIAEVALYLPPSSFTGDCTHLALWYLCFTCIKTIAPLNLAYNALGQKLTSMCVTKQQRDRVFAMKHWCFLCGCLLGSLMPYTLSLFYKSDGIHEHEHNRVFYARYVIVSQVFIILSTFFMVWRLSVFEKQHAEETNKKHDTLRNRGHHRLPIIVGVKIAFQNRAFLVLLLLFVLEAAKNLLSNNTYPLYKLHVLEFNTTQRYELWTGIATTTSTLVAMISTPVWVRIVGRIGTYRSWVIAAVLQIPVGLCWFWLIFSYTDVYTYLVLLGVNSFLQRGPAFLQESIKASAIDYDKLHSGQQREVTLESCWDLFPRYVAMPGSIFSMRILEYFGGYSHQKKEHRPEETIRLKYTLSIQNILLPAVLSLINVALMLYYPINDEAHEGIRNGIKAHGEGREIFDSVSQQHIAPPSVLSVAESQQKNTLNHFFTTELMYYVKSRRGNSLYARYVARVERLLSVLWFLGCACLFALFSYGTVSIRYWKNEESPYLSAGMNTLYLWVSSVLFTLSMFHHLRVEQAKKLVSISIELIESHYHGKTQ